MWLIKGCTKIAIMTNGAGYHKRLPPTGDEGRPAQARSEIEAIQDPAARPRRLSANHGEHRNAPAAISSSARDRGMLDFVDYRKSANKNEPDFVHQLQQWQGLSEDKVMQTEVFAMDCLA